MQLNPLRLNYPSILRGAYDTPQLLFAEPALNVYLTGI
jgi:hypothetical protein